MRKCIYSLVFVVVLASSCRSVDNADLRQFTEAPLFGMVYDSESSPVAGALVVFDEEKSAETDINGRVLFSKVSRGNHSVIITKEGFEEVMLELDFSNRDQVLYSTLISLSNILNNLESSLHTGKITEAKSFMVRASKINPDDIRFRYLNVVYLMEVKKYSGAFDRIVLLRKEYPYDPYIIMTQAKILFYGLKEKKEALGLLQDFLQSNKNDELKTLMNKMDSEIETGSTIENGTGESND